MFIKCCFFNSFNHYLLSFFTVFNAKNVNEIVLEVLAKQLIYNDS